MSRVLVLNATGKVSAHIVDTLAARGLDVTAASRHPRAASTDHVRRVHFDYADPATYGPALEGVDRVFWLNPPMVLDAMGHSAAFWDAALPRVRKVVTMTASGVEYDDGIPLRQVELRVERSGVAWTHLRPTWFDDNFHTFWVGGILHGGVVAVPAGDARTAFIDARDIGDAAVAALLDPATDGKAYTLTGPASLTYAEAAAILSEAAGRPIGYLALTDEAFHAGAVQAGLPADYAGFLVVLFQAVRARGVEAVSGAVPELTGHPARTLEAYAREHAAAFRG